MSIAANRALARSQRKRLGSEFSQAAVETIGNELTDFVKLAGKMTSENRTANKNLDFGKEELGIAPAKESFFEKASNLVKNPNSMFDNLRKPKDEFFTSNGREYNTEEVQAIGRLSKSTSPEVLASLNGKKLSDMLGRKLSPEVSSKENNAISNLAPKTIDESSANSPFGSKTGFGASRSQYNSKSLTFSPKKDDTLSSKLMSMAPLRPDTSKVKIGSPETEEDMIINKINGETSTIKQSLPTNQGFKHHVKDEDNFFGNGITGMGNRYND